MDDEWLDQRVLGALVTDAAAAALEFDDARSWLTSALLTPMGLLGAEVSGLRPDAASDPAGSASVAPVGATGRPRRAR